MYLQCKHYAIVGRSKIGIKLNPKCEHIVLLLEELNMQDEHRVTDVRTIEFWLSQKLVLLGFTWEM